jgi:hypothetical protein
MSEQRDNSGAIFINERKESDNHPDRTGSAMIDGKEYWVSGWIKKSGDKPSFLSLAFKPKDKPAEKLDGRRAGERPRNPDADNPW